MVSWVCHSCAMSPLSCASGVSMAEQLLLCRPAWPWAVSLPRAQRGVPPVWCPPSVVSPPGTRAAPRPCCLTVGHFFGFVHGKDGRR